MSACQHPDCHNPGSRKVPVMLSRRGRRCCVFQFFCAAHVPIPLPKTAAAPAPRLPTHARPTGAVHVPRVWEITGRAPIDRIRAVREWNEARRAHLHA